MPDRSDKPVFSSLSDKATQEIKTQILSGRLVGGMHLQEQILAEHLHMSRTPIREALSRLAQENLLVAGPKRGFKVRIFTYKEILDAFEVRASLEGTACRIAAERGLSGDACVELNECVEEGFRLNERGDNGLSHLEAWMTMNERFHSIIVSATDNAMLEEMLNAAQCMPLASIRHIHWYHNKERYLNFTDIAAKQHAVIVDAIRLGQSYRAEAAMREHIWAAAELVKDRAGHHAVFGGQDAEDDNEFAKAFPIVD